MPEIVVVGGGSNSLTAACYLAKAGLDVLVVERNDESQTGGGVVSVSPAPGFVGDSHAMGYMTLMPNPAIRKDEIGLLSKHGLEFCWSDSPFTTLLDDGRSLMSFGDLEKTIAEIAKFSRKDAEAYRAFVAEVKPFLPLLVHGFYAPPMPEAGFKALLSASEEGSNLLRFMDMSVLEVLEERFENEVVRMHFAKWCAEMMIGPEVPGAGIAIVLILCLSHEYRMGTIKGGAANLTQALIRSLRSYGGRIRFETTVKKLIMEGKACKGVLLENGEEIRASKGVVANIHPWRLAEMIPGVDPALAAKAKTVKLSDYGAVNQQIALSEKPIYKAGDAFDRVTVLEIMGPDYEGFLSSFRDLKAGRFDLEHLSPLVCVQSNIDPSRAPPGKAEVYLYAFAPLQIEGGWETRKTEIADALFDWFASFTTNIDRSKILGRFVEAPPDHARHSLNMMDGDIMGCAMGYGQIMGGRPIPELADYTVPGISGLHLVGPIQHPGGTVTLGGRATAIKVLDDLSVPLGRALDVY